MKNQILSVFGWTLIILSLLGIWNSILENPTVFMKKFTVMLLVGILLYFIYKIFGQSLAKKKGKIIFLRAARNRKVKTNNVKKTIPIIKRTSLNKLTASHLTVIKGKNKKKKHRVSS
ncbi:hypothetical protein [Neobacillus sp. D3-1R]|uniref:hypothetical protein n=1 Tax=Neobacillus sp. D3-1R TaxID=3445778 RepID=UPI003FA03D71